MNEIYLHSANDLVRLIKSRQVSPVEVVQAFSERVSQINPQLNAICTLSSDALDRAQEAESAIMRGVDPGPLHGLPVTIKDTIETRGLLSTSGSQLRAQFVPHEDAPAVARLKAAGAIVLGKTNVAEMAMDYTADNPVFGITNNPYNLSHSPGGSSGGEAAAIASCMSPAGLGSDLAGSIRLPAHFCGIAGLKPGTGRVPGQGQYPSGFGPYSLGGVAGPMARTVDDLELLFSVLADERLKEPPDLKGTAVAWYTYDNVAPVTNETRSAVITAVSALADAGLRTEDLLPPGVERGYELWLKLFSRASVVLLQQAYRGHEDKGGDFVRWRLKTADDHPVPSLDDYINSWMERDRLRIGLLRWMEDYPLLVAPVGASNAPLHGALKLDIHGNLVSMFRAFSYSQTFNVFDLPAVVVPVGMDTQGLPIGVQIVGRPFSESTVLQAARIVERAVGGWRRPR